MDINQEDEFKRSLVHTIRALAKDDTLDVVFGADEPFLADKTIHLPLIASYLSDKQRLLIRGQADSFALCAAYHQPSSTENEPLLDMLENHTL